MPRPTVSDTHVISYMVFYNPVTMEMEFAEKPSTFDPVEKGAKIAVSASGATNIVPAVLGKIIRVTSVVLVSNGTVNVKWQSNLLPTDVTGLAYLVANTGFSSGYHPKGHFETLRSEGLDINLSAGIAVGGWLKYIEASV